MRRRRDAVEEFLSSQKSRELTKQESTLLLAVLLIVFHDEDQLAAHRRFGIENVNVDPGPTSLFTQIAPPCNSTNLLASARPRPVPSCFRASSAPTWRNS